MKVIDSIWFNTLQGNFGFVIGENDIGQRIVYAGVVDGRDQHANEEEILSWGNKISPRRMAAFMAQAKKQKK